MDKFNGILQNAVEIALCKKIHMYIVNILDTNYLTYIRKYVRIYVCVF